MSMRGWLLTALLVAGLGCSSSSGEADASMTDAALARACQSQRDAWATVVGALPNTCSTVADCTVVGGSNNCSAGQSIAPDLAGSVGCYGLAANTAAYAGSAEANDLAASLEASCRRFSFDCLQADPECKNGVCVLGSTCHCLCRGDAGSD